MMTIVINLMHAMHIKYLFYICENSFHMGLERDLMVLGPDLLFCFGDPLQSDLLVLLRKFLCLTGAIKLHRV